VMAAMFDDVIEHLFPVDTHSSVYYPHRIINVTAILYYNGSTVYLLIVLIGDSSRCGMNHRSQGLQNTVYQFKYTPYNYVVLWHDAARSVAV